MRRARFFLASALAIAGACAIAAQAQPQSCDALGGLKLQDATITTAAAGVLPRRGHAEADTRVEHQDRSVDASR
jgi:hypothetical protein